MTFPRGEIEEWQEALQRFDEIADATPEVQNQYLEQPTLNAAVRARLEEMLRAAASDSPLDDSLDRLAVDQPPAPDDLVGKKIGDWTLESVLGLGGHSLVYRARRALAKGEQFAAVKLLPMGLRGAASIARLEREQSLLAGLYHPNIATLLDAGVAEDGTPYMVTELVDGLQFDGFVKTSEPSKRERVKLIRQICGAVGFAHRRLVVHLDLKPGNVMVGASGEVKLLDFGIGHLLREVEGQTVTRAFTPGYAAPEQVQGLAITTATDVYALGVMLCECLTGEREVRQAGAAIRGDLAHIVGRATHDDADDRYASAEELGEDLQRWLDGEPVEATAPSLAYRLRLLGRRNPVAAGVSLVALAAAALGVAGVLWQADVARTRAAEAEAAAAQATLERNRATQANALLKGLFAGADPELQLGRTLTARDLVDQAATSLGDATDVDEVVKDPLHLALSDVYRSLGEYTASMRQVESASSLDETAEWQLAQAATLAGQGQWIEARAGYDRAITSQDIPADERFAALLAFGDVLGELGEEARAKEVFAEAEGLAGDGGQRIAYLTGFADFLQSRNDSDGALALIDEAELLVADEPSPVVEANLLAQRAEVQLEAGLFDDAEQAIAGAESRFRGVYGASHPAYLGTRLLRSSLHRARGEMTLAREVTSEVATAAKAVLGAHPITVQAINTLGLLDYDEGQLEPAVRQITDGIEMLEAVSGKGHSQVGVLRANLASVQRLNGNFDAAAMQARLAYDIHQRTLPPHHPDYLHTRAHYAHSMRAGGDLDAALVEYLALADTIDDYYGQEHPQSLGAHVNVSSLLRTLGNYEESLTHAEIAHRATVKLYPEDSPTLMTVRASYVQSLIDNGRYEPAEPLLASLSSLGANGERPNPRVVLMEGRVAASADNWPLAAERRDLAAELMAKQPDGGFRYQADLATLTSLIDQAQ